MTNSNRTAGFLAALLALTLQACGGGGSDNSRAQQPPLPPPAPPPPPAAFAVTVTNLTNAQPLSPVAVIAHRDAYSVFTVGAPATVGLEELAEGGDNTALIAEATGNVAVRATRSGAAPIGPGASERVDIEVLQADVSNLRISVSTMLVNTNDAISGINGTDVSGMAVGDAVMLRAIAYDAGTEANTELASDIPGPAGGGEGFNPARSDRFDRVTMHTGVVSQDDGFAASALSGQHRFDNPTVQVRIERVN